MRLYKALVSTAILAMVSFSLIYIFIFYSGSTKAPKVMTKKRILLLANVYQNPYWQIIKKGAEDAASNRGCIIEYNGPQTLNTKESLQIFDMGIAISVDGILTYVQEEKQYIPEIKKAIDAGIPVFTVDTDAVGSNRMAYIGTDNVEAGNAAGEQLVNLKGGKAKVGIIMAGNTATSQLERVDGFKKYIAPYKDMKIVTIGSSNSDVIEAELVAKKMLKEYPKINELYCTGSVDGIGAARAVVDLKKAGKVKIVCFDDLPETLEYLKKDVIQASIVQKPYQMGYDGVNLMMDKLEGKKVHGQFLMGIIVVSKDNVNNYNVEMGEMN